MRDRIYKFALNRPWIVLFSSILLVFATAYGTKNLVFKGDYKVFLFSDQNPQLSTLKPMQDIYSKTTEESPIIPSIRVNSVTDIPKVAAVIREKL